MPPLKSWIVCESSVQWAAALRLAITRRREALQMAMARAVNLPSHVREVRTIPELFATLRQHGDAVPLVEVNRHNLGEVLEIPGRLRIYNVRPAALLDESLREYSPGRKQIAADHDLIVAALQEAGFVDGVESPRQIGGLIGLVARYAATRPETKASADLSSLAEFAWAALPWQDA